MLFAYLIICIWITNHGPNHIKASPLAVNHGLLATQATWPEEVKVKKQPTTGILGITTPRKYQDNVPSTKPHKKYQKGSKGPHPKPHKYQKGSKGPYTKPHKYQKVAKVPSTDPTYAEEFQTRVTIPHAQFMTRPNSNKLSHLINMTQNSGHPEFGDNCWMDIRPAKVYDELDTLDSNYKKQLAEFAVEVETFDKAMLEAILSFQGKAYRAIHNFGGLGMLIPAGLNLGGYSLMVFDDSALFFHRMKLRNDTRFKVMDLHNDLEKLVLHTVLSLNDLHLRGSYERAITEGDNSTFYYKPSAGTLDLLLRNGKYYVEGRYRLLQDRLIIEDIISTITVEGIMATYSDGKSASASIKLEQEKLQEFIDRMKLDLDHWLKDYFNDYLALIKVNGGAYKYEVQNYDKMKGMIINKFVESSIDKMVYRLRGLRAVSLRAPDYTIHSNKGTSIQLKNGVIRGLDSMIRRSIGTTNREDSYRSIDCIIAFSKLKIEYQYEAQMPLGTPLLTGSFVLTADTLAARMTLILRKDPESFILKFNFFDQTRPDSLVIEGPLNRRISNFKNLIETQVFTLMTRSLMTQIITLENLSNCKLGIPGHVDPDEIFEEALVTQGTDTHNSNEKGQDTDRHNSNEDNPASSEDTTNDPYYTTRCSKKDRTPYNDNDYHTLTDDNDDHTLPDDKDDHTLPDDNDDHTLTDDDGDHIYVTMPPNPDDFTIHSDNDDHTPNDDNNDHSSKEINNDNTLAPDNGEGGKAKGGSNEWGIDKSESIEFYLPNDTDKSNSKKMRLKYKEYALLSEIQRRNNNDALAML